VLFCALGKFEERLQAGQDCCKNAQKANDDFRFYSNRLRRN
jgi:hypothetical protein